MDSFMMYNGKDGVYSYTYPVERLQAKGHPAFPLAVVKLSASSTTTLAEVNLTLCIAPSRMLLTTSIFDRYVM